ncbi:MAG: hypothetical protein HN945_26065 [Deltaproteobacteria bacterium]|nr:hypothetical protein [Deltaproteobacteria bacterium]
MTRFLVLKLALARFKNVTIRYQWRKGLTYLFSFLGILLIGGIWGFCLLAWLWP